MPETATVWQPCEDLQSAVQRDSRSVRGEIPVRSLCLQRYITQCFEQIQKSCFFAAAHIENFSGFWKQQGAPVRLDHIINEDPV